MPDYVELHDEIRLSDLLKALLKRWLSLALVLLVGFIVGVAYSYISVEPKTYYGTTVTYYINPITANDDDVGKIYGAYSVSSMNDIIKQLSADDFAEHLLTDENGLPQKGKYGAEVDAKIDAATAVLAQETALQADYDTKVSSLGANHADTLAVKAALEAKNQESREAIVKVNEVWQKTDLYTKDVSMVVSSMTFQHSGSMADYQSVLADSFIEVTISVLEDEAFAENLFNQIKEKVPAFVEKYMFVPPGYVGTTCQRKSRIDDITPNTVGAFSSGVAIKSGILIGGVLFVIAAIAVLVKEGMDKSLKDYEEMATALEIPVLGVIPQINAQNDSSFANVNQITKHLKVPVLGMIPEMKDDTVSENDKETEE